MERLSHTVKDILSGKKRDEIKAVPRLEKSIRKIIARPGDSASDANELRYRSQEIKQKVIDEAAPTDPITHNDFDKLIAHIDIESPNVRTLAYQIASAMTRVDPKADPKGLIILNAALTLLSISNGNDNLITVSRRLMTSGISMLRKRA